MTPIEAISIYGAWLQAAEHLLTCHECRDYNLILEITAPGSFEEHDKEVRDVVDRFLKDHDMAPLDTVAGTIFPLGLYQRFGIEGVFTKYPEVVFPKTLLSKGSDWGRYAYRLVRVETGDGGKNVLVDKKTGAPINPLKKIIDKLKNYERNPKRAMYEANLVDPGCEIPVYRASHDRCFTMGGPCLSHISFKVTSDCRLSMTAFYRSHFYVQRALGNLLGLSWLLCSVAQETGFDVGPLTCISSMAQLEPAKNWEKPELREMITNCSSVFAPVSGWSERPIWIRQNRTAS